MSSLVGAIEPDAWIVCEVGVFQLEDMKIFHPRIGVLVNLEPDHLDRYVEFEAYAETKLRMFALQTEDDVAVVPRGFGAGARCRAPVEFAAADPLPAEPALPGSHNRENAAAATVAARAAGVSDDAIARALRSFPGVAHRIEEVGTVGGIRYVNDSKATNVAAAVRALEALPGCTARRPRRPGQERELRAARDRVSRRRSRLPHRRGVGRDSDGARGGRRSTRRCG